jgi:hypothetical protein
MKEGSCDHDFLRQLCTAQRFSSMIDIGCDYHPGFRQIALWILKREISDRLPEVFRFLLIFIYQWARRFTNSEPLGRRWQEA